MVSIYFGTVTPGTPATAGNPSTPFIEFLGDWLFSFSCNTALGFIDRGTPGETLRGLALDEILDDENDSLNGGTPTSLTLVSGVTFTGTVTGDDIGFFWSRKRLLYQFIFTGRTRRSFTGRTADLLPAEPPIFTGRTADLADQTLQ